MPHVIALPDSIQVQIVEKTMDFSTVTPESGGGGRAYTFAHSVPAGDFTELGFAEPVMLTAGFQSGSAGPLGARRRIRIIEQWYNWDQRGWANGYVWTFWIPWPWNFEELPRLRALYTFGDRILI